MSEPEEIRFACIGCGALNPVGAEVCSGCGHRFAGTDIVSTPPSAVPPPVRRPPTPERFYEPPKARVAAPTTFRIGTAMAIIAVIAVCLGAFAADLTLGIITTLGLLPATIRTFIVSATRQAEGRPMSLGGQITTFCLTILSVILIVISSAIAFCVTCLPVGLGSNSLEVAVGVGILAALGAAFLVIRGLLRLGRSRAQDRDQIRWQ